MPNIIMADPSGLRWHKETIEFTSKNGYVTINRKFKNFVLIWEAEEDSVPAVADIPSNTALFCVCVYINEHISDAVKGFALKPQSGSLAGTSVNPANFAVTNSTIQVTTYSSANNNVGKATVLQIELPENSDSGLWRLQTILGGG